MQSALAQRYVPANLCAINSDTSYESITLPIDIASQYPSNSTQVISIEVGDTEQSGGVMASSGYESK